MIKSISVQIQTFVTEDVICDMCGKSCKIDLGRFNEFPHMKLEANWGYGSQKDCTYWRAQICETCVDNKLKPLINFEIGSVVSVF